MIKKRVNYIDYNGDKRAQDMYFNFSEAELIELNMVLPGGLGGYIKKIIETKDSVKLASIFKDLLIKSYGERTEDGRFVKNDEIREKFVSSVAYSELYMGLLQDTDQAIGFIKGLLPSTLTSKLPADWDKTIEKDYENRLEELGLEPRPKDKVSED